MSSDDSTDGECEAHGETIHHDGICVLCAYDADEDTPAMELAIGIEQALRGQFASVEDIEATLAERDE